MTLDIASRLQHPNEKVRARAAFRLATIGNDQALPLLLTALRDPSVRVRRQAAYALSVLCPVNAISALIDALHDPDTEVYRRSALALGKIGAVAAIDPLITAFSHPNDEVRSAAQQALIRIGKPAVEPLITLYDHSDQQVRARVVQTLGRIGDPQAMDVFIRSLNDPDDWIRWMTASIARSLPDERLAQPLIARLDDSFMRWNAAKALGFVGGEKAIAALTKIINAVPSDDEALYHKAREAIELIRQRSTEQ